MNRRHIAEHVFPEHFHQQLEEKRKMRLQNMLDFPDLNKLSPADIKALIIRCVFALSSLVDGEKLLKDMRDEINMRLNILGNKGELND